MDGYIWLLWFNNEVNYTVWIILIVISCKVENIILLILVNLILKSKLNKIFTCISFQTLIYYMPGYPGIFPKVNIQSFWVISPCLALMNLHLTDRFNTISCYLFYNSYLILSLDWTRECNIQAFRLRTQSIKIVP